MRRAGTVVLALLFATTLAHADDDDARKARCGAGYEGGQRQRSDGKLLAARDAFRTCSRDCSASLAKQCVEWLDEVEREIPTIVLSVEGDDRTDVRVTLDGAPLRDSLDGRPVEVDPGPHVVRFVSADGKTSSEKKVVIRSAERLQAVSLPLASVRLDPRSTSKDLGTGGAHRPFPWYSGVAAGLFVAGVAVGTGLWISGRVMESNLSKEGCAPFCDPARVDPIDARYQIGAIAFGVAAVSLVVTLITYALRPTRYEQ